MLLFGTLLLLHTTASAGCPVTADALRTHMATAYTAYTAMDVEAFNAGYAEISAELGCVDALLQPEDAAQLHLIQALKSWVDRDPQSLSLAFQGLLAVEPAFELPTEVAAKGSRLGLAFESARQAAPTPSVPYKKGWLVLDGVYSEGAVPEGRTCLVQCIDSDGDLGTWYLYDGKVPGVVTAAAANAGDPLAWQVPGAPTQPTNLDAHSDSRRSWGLLAGGLASGAVASAGLLYAAHLKSVFPDSAGTAEAERRYTLNQVSGIGGYALAGGAGGLLVAAVVTGKW